MSVYRDYEGYIWLLRNRWEYFQNKKITELTNDEIKEFLNLREEVAEVTQIKKEVENIWENTIKPFFFDAARKYQERVLRK